MIGCFKRFNFNGNDIDICFLLSSKLFVPPHNYFAVEKGGFTPFVKMSIDIGFHTKTSKADRDSR